MNTNNALRRRVGAGLALAAGAAAGAFAMTTTSPLANAGPTDAVVPVLPDPVNSVDFNSSAPFTGAIGLPPLWDGYTAKDNFSYTDLLGYTNTSDPMVVNYLAADPPDATSNIGALIDPNQYLPPYPDFYSVEWVDPRPIARVLPGNEAIGASTFDHTAISGWNNYYELTPFDAGQGFTNNVNDTLVYDPTGLGTNNAGIDFGIQYLDLPNATTPVDEINVLGQGGEILFSIPWTGDLLAGL